MQKVYCSAKMPGFVVLFVLLLFSSAAFARIQPGVLYDQWYTVTLNKNHVVAYYNERVDVTPSEVAVHVKMYKKNTQGLVVQETIDAVAKNDLGLSPVRFQNVTPEMNASGQFAGNLLKLRFVPKTGSIRQKQVAVSDLTFLSALLPVWASLRFSGFIVGQPRPLNTVIENNPEFEYRGVLGQIKMLGEDKYAQLTQTKRVSVALGGVNSTWWIKANGMPLNILWPDHKIAIQVVSKEKALETKL